jgi:predicted acylesterase/phospholipase RssA
MIERISWRSSMISSRSRRWSAFSVSGPRSFAEIYLRENRIIGLVSTGRSAEEVRTIEMPIRNRIDISGAARELSDPAADLGFLARTTVLILQGGGALDAFECGVVRALEEARILPGVVGGVSIGAVNGAIIAANQRNTVQALESFWAELSIGPPWALPDTATALAVWSAMMFGVQGYFRPRWLSPWIDGEVFPFQWTSLYDAWPFAKLLEKYIDFPSLATSD